MATKLSPLLCELHSHTTWSDGELTPRELCDLYGRAGFDVLARVYNDDGFALKAAAVAKQALKLDPTLVATRLFLAELYERLGLQSDAAVQYRIALDYYRAGEDVEKVGKVPEALARLQKGLKEEPGDG